MVYNVNLDVLKPTEIYYSSKYHYPNGVEFSVAADELMDVTHSLDAKENFLTVTLLKKIGSNGVPINPLSTRVEVNLKPKGTVSILGTSKASKAMLRNGPSATSGVATNSYKEITTS